jgi:hypothetical protein
MIRMLAVVMLCACAVGVWVLVLLVRDIGMFLGVWP